jgi:hypothetical protein
MGITAILLGLDAFAEKFFAIRAQNDAFDFRAAKINADAEGRNLFRRPEDFEFRAAIFSDHRKPQLVRGGVSPISFSINSHPALTKI